MLLSELEEKRLSAPLD
jgi:hypothetical protein